MQRSSPSGDSARISCLSTPEARFGGLSDFDHEPRTVDVGGLRMAYVDAGPRGAAPVVLLHGNPIMRGAPTTIRRARHFLQEDQGSAIAAFMDEQMRPHR